MNDLISIIIPVYNVEKFLKKCIDSVINQSYQNLEILLIDDGSTDNSGIICDEYEKKDNRIKVVHKQNSGLSATRNYGIDISSGKYIAFIDSDDYISNDYCEILYDLITKQNADVAGIDMCMVKENGTRINISKIKEPQVKVFEKEEILNEILLYRSFKSYVCNKLYKRYIFDTVRFKEGISYEDNLFTYEMSKIINRIAYVNKECYFYLKRSNSITSTCSEKNLNDFLNVVIYRYEDIKNKQSCKEVYNIYALLVSIISLSIKYIISNKEYAEVKEKSNYIFDIIKAFMIDKNNELEILPFLDELQAQKASLYLITYNIDLFYNFIKIRQKMQREGKL